MTSRRQARRQALFLVYQWDLGEAEIGSQYAGEIDPWARRARRGDGRAGRRARRADHRRRPRAGRADRLGVVERSALRVAIRELDRGEVPFEVAIDEAVGFAKRYASEEGARLVNGILGRIQREAAVAE